MSGEPVFSRPAIDLVQLTSIIGHQLRAELERVARSAGIAVPGFVLTVWANEQLGAKFISNRVDEEWLRAMEVVMQSHGYVVWKIGKGAPK